MFDSVRRLFGVINVEEREGYVIITGHPNEKLMADIHSYWKTSRITKYMFTFSSGSRIVFHRFYAIEFRYMLEQLKSRSDKKRNKAPLSVYQELIDKLNSETWLRDIETDHPSILNKNKLSMFHKTPLAHQKTFFELYDDRIPKYNLKGYVLALDTGGGKTLTSIMLSEQLGVDHVITLCPSRALHNVWQKAFETEYKQPQTTWSSRDGTPLPDKAPKAILIHYEYLEKAFDWIVKLGKSGKRIALIIDESHSFNEIVSARTQLLIDLCRQVDFVTTLWLSATPIKAIGSEMIPMLSTIDRLMNKATSESFRQIFGKSATKGVDIARNRMGMVSYVVTLEKSKPTFFDLPVTIPNPKPYLLSTIKEDMLKFVTERTIYYRDNFQAYLDLYNEGVRIFETKMSKTDEPILAEYKQHIKTIRSGYDPATMVEIAKFCNDFELKRIYPVLPKVFNNKWRNSRSVVKYVKLKIQGECLGNIVGKRRAEAVTALIPYVGLKDLIDKSIKKVVIFTSYVKVVDETVLYLEKLGIPCLYVHGSNSLNVSGIVNEFAKNDRYKVLVTTYPSLSSAMPLTMANTMVTMNSEFRVGTMEQAYGRIDRIDQDTPTEIYNVALDTGNEPNISTRSYDIMAWSKDMVETIMGTREEHLVDIVYNEAMPEMVGISLGKGIVIESGGIMDTLLIEKEVNKDREGEAGPMSITAALMSQRKEMVQDVLDAAEEADKLEESDNGGDGSDSSSDDDGDSDDGGFGDDDGMFDDPAEDAEEDDEDDSDDDDVEEEEEVEEEEVEETVEETTEEVATEALTHKPKRFKSNWDIFGPLEKQFKQRRAVLESFGFALEEVSDGPIDLQAENKDLESEIDDENVAFTKDGISESLTKLSEITRKYVSNSESYHEKMSVSIPKMQERIINFEVQSAKGALEYTNKIVDDVAVIKNVSYKGSSKLRDSIKRLADYMQDSNDASALLANSPFDKLKDIFNAEGFLDKGSVLEYRKQVPGFITVKVNTPPYSGYMKTHVTDYQYFTTKDENPSELYDMVPISITEDKDMIYYIEHAKKIVLGLGVNVDILSKVVANFNKLDDELKIIRTNVNDDVYEKLSEIGIDDKVKDFIKHKLLVELISTNVGITFDYLTSFITVVEKCVKFKDIIEETPVEDDESSDHNTSVDDM